MGVFVALFLVVPVLIHAKVVEYQQDGPKYRRGVLWTPYNITSLWFLPATEGVNITARYNDGVGNAPKWFDKHYDANVGLWTKVTYVFTKSPKSKIELHFVNSNFSSTLNKFNIEDPGDLWSVHLVYGNGTVIWSEQDPQHSNIVGFVYGGNRDAINSSRYMSISPSTIIEECSCVLPVIYWLMGIFLAITLVVVLAVFLYKFLRKRSASTSSVLTRSNKYEVTVTRSSLNHSASAVSRLSATDFQSTGNSKYLPTEGVVTAPYETSLSPLIRSNSRPQSSPVNLSAPRHSRPQSQFIISEKHPIPCTMVIQPPTPPPDEVVTLGPSSSLGSLQPYAATLGDSADDFSSFSDRSSADGESRCSVDNSINTKF